jgi:TRAP-type C4-dicarboxylate transport system permease small subunit
MISLDMFYVRTSSRFKTILWVIHKMVSASLGVVMVIAFLGLYPFISTEYYSSMPTFSKLWQYVPMAVTGAFLCIKSLFELMEKARGEKFV